MSALIRIGYVPEHFLTPVLLSAKHGFFKKNHCNVELVPQPSGTGQMISSYKDGKIDMAIGLTEGWINGSDTNPDLYCIVGTYVASPLCWAISTGMKAPIKSASELKNGKIGVSRIGSGSYVMSFVFADQQGWLKDTQSAPFDFKILDTFKGLRDGVNGGEADAFMWERFTTKKYYDSAEIRQIGEIYTPWSSWLITASPKVPHEDVSKVLETINEGIKYYREHHEESMEEIYTNLDYSKDDAEAWSKTVEYPEDVKVVDQEMMHKTIATLQKAGLMKNYKTKTA